MRVFLLGQGDWMVLHISNFGPSQNTPGSGYENPVPPGPTVLGQIHASFGEGFWPHHSSFQHLLIGLLGFLKRAPTYPQLTHGPGISGKYGIKLNAPLRSERKAGMLEEGICRCSQAWVCFPAEQQGAELHADCSQKQLDYTSL